jgi:hypothetical protein
LVRERCGGDSPGGEAERQGRRSGRGEAVGRSARSVVAWRGVEAEEEVRRRSRSPGGRNSCLDDKGRGAEAASTFGCGRAVERDKSTTRPGGAEDAVGALGRRMPFVAWHARRLRGIYRHVTFR